jgi:hypothetical protein
VIKNHCPNSKSSNITHRIHGAAIYGNMDPINIPPMLAYIPYMDPMGNGDNDMGLSPRMISKY